jgi:hypothetical protein
VAAQTVHARPEIDFALEENALEDQR